MTGRRLVNSGAAALALCFVFACGDDPAPTTDAGTDAGTVPEAGDLCPDSNNTRVHYVERDPNACTRVTLTCTVDQNGFNNRCGCGCIDKGDPLCPPFEDPAVRFISRDPAECGTELPNCPDGQNAFNTTCGCGCTTPGG